MIVFVWASPAGLCGTLNHLWSTGVGWSRRTLTDRQKRFRLGRLISAPLNLSSFSGRPQSSECEISGLRGPTGEQAPMCKDLSSSVSSFNVLYFSEYCSFTSLVKFIPRYFILLDAIVNGIFLNFLFLLLLYKNVTYF